MNYSKNYVVTTQWGCFSLDEYAYRDYLAGKLWISWSPRKPETPHSVDAEVDTIPSNVTKKALDLRERADRVGFFAVLDTKFTGLKIPSPYMRYMSSVAIEELSLTVRAYNGMKRAGVHTLGDLQALMTEDEGLFKIRNIGIKSVEEIRHAFFEETYRRLTSYDKAVFWQKLLNL